MTIDQLRARFDALTIAINSGRRGCFELRRERMIVKAAMLALEIKEKRAA